MAGRVRATWCGHCKNLEPTGKRPLVNIRVKVKLGAVDATVASWLTQQYGVSRLSHDQILPRRQEGLPGKLRWRPSADDIGRSGHERHVVSLPAPEIVEITSRRIQRKTAGEILYALAFLPHSTVRANAGTNLHQNAEEARRQIKNTRLGWVSLGAAPSRPNLERAIGYRRFGLPCRWPFEFEKDEIPLTGSFGFDGISEF